MILRSITRHVREQNWTAVALDFLIVVLGILLALQISRFYLISCGNPVKRTPAWLTRECALEWWADA
jgi:hypothetical protein